MSKSLLIKVFTIFASFLFTLKALSADFYERLLNEPVLRFYLNHAPGLGHQSHTALIARRLKESGYTGIIEILYTSESESKIPILFPDFDPQKTDYFDSMNQLRFVRLNANPQVWMPDGSINHQLKHLPFVITGGDDSHWFRDRYLREVMRADSLIVLNPQGWNVDSYIQTDSGKRLEFPELNPLLTRGSQHYWQGERVDQNLVDQLELLKRSHFVIPFYGHNDMVAERLARIANSLQLTDLSRPVALVIFNHLSPKHINKLGQYMDNVPLLDLGDELKNKVNFVQVGPSNPATFEKVFTQMSMPLVFVSGRNSIGLMLPTGIPFMEAQYSFEENFYELQLQKKPESWRMLSLASSILNAGFNTTASAELGEYLSRVIQGDPYVHSIYQYFAEHSAENIHRDKLTMGLEKSLDQLEKWGVRFINPERAANQNLQNCRLMFSSSL